ncbi:hypothetical protein [Acidianus sp. HS-5]|uniref:hypothetical protein n=1 Tax=Acidianus sp. HS-5 TaxID=2886040 RepID=UPI001F2AE6F5|nr:hypothetical protein [Acidianus sp. HS-5]BDC18593.1 hypothetical protein HS5_14830 [Acidianus sp. HS-5]
METEYGVNKRGIIIMTTFSLFYAMLETGMDWDPNQGLLSIFSLTSQYFYRFLYTSIFLYPSYMASRKLFSALTIWYFIYGSLTEDLFYWLIMLEPPYSWSWFYPVYYYIPIPDVIELLLLVVIAKKKKLVRVNLLFSRSNT